MNSRTPKSISSYEIAFEENADAFMGSGQLSKLQGITSHTSTLYRIIKLKFLQYEFKSDKSNRKGVFMNFGLKHVLSLSLSHSLFSFLLPKSLMHSFALVILLDSWHTLSIVFVLRGGRQPCLGWRL